jgi:hypothetical protein
MHEAPREAGNNRRSQKYQLHRLYFFYPLIKLISPNVLKNSFTEKSGAEAVLGEAEAIPRAALLVGRQ